MMVIGQKTIDKSIGCCAALMRDYRQDLDKAYLRADDALNVSLKVKWSPGKHGGIDIKADISFVAEQVKDSTTSHVDEDQMGLFDNSGSDNPPKDRRGRVGNPPRFKPLGG